jgi:hypothetical protein
MRRRVERKETEIETDSFQLKIEQKPGEKDNIKVVQFKVMNRHYNVRNFHIQVINALLSVYKQVYFNKKEYDSNYFSKFTRTEEKDWYGNKCHVLTRTS